MGQEGLVSIYLVPVGQGTTQRVAALDRQIRYRPLPMRRGGDDGHTRGGEVSRTGTAAPTEGGVERIVERGPRAGGRGGDRASKKREKG